MVIQMNETNLKDVRKPATRKLMAIYSFPSIMSTLVMGTIGFSLLFLYSLAYGVNPALVGIATGVGYLSIASSQFLLGWISDGKYTKWGRRKPFLIIFAPLTAISFVFVLLPNLILVNPDETTLFIWLLIWDVALQFSVGFSTVHGAWIPELFSVEERPRLSQVLNIFKMLGQGIMLIFTFVILTGAKDRIVANPGVIPADFLWTVIILAILLVVFYYLGVFLIPTEPYHEIKSNYIVHLKRILKDKNYVLVTLMQGIASFAWIMLGSILLIYIEEVLNFGTVEYLIAALLLLVGTLLFFSLWRRLIEKNGKKTSLLHLFIYAMIWLCLSLIGLIPLTPPFNVIFGLLFVLGVTAIMGGWYLFPAIYNADLAEEGQKNTGELVAGIYKGFPSILLNIFQALGTMFLGFVIALPPIGTSENSIGYYIWGPICAVILIIAYIYTKKFITLDFEWEKK